MSGSFLTLVDDGQVVPLDGSCPIGRQSGNRLLLANERVSRQHALIQWQRIDPTGAGAFLLIDLGSSNGTMLNGARISRPTVLADGDIIEIGGHRIEFRGESPADGCDEETVGSTVLDIVRRPLWLMVGDIVGSTRRSRELPPEEVPRINGAWFKTCRELVEAHGGHMNQYLGDGFFCYWNDTIEAKHHIPGLLRRFTILQRDSQPPFRVVLHFGPTVLGSVPTLTSLNLHGPNVNFAFRMEKLAGSLGVPILLSEEAAAALQLPETRRVEADLSGFDGRHTFVIPGLEPSGD